jgi:hydroxymethylbilane synthase
MKFDTSSTPLRIATRGSRQALAQAGVVAASIESATQRAVDLVLIETTGDVRQDVPLHTIGGQGVFVKEVQRAVLDARADIAVHSAKDLPSEVADGLVIGAFTQRRDARDVLIGSTLTGLAEGATVASGSVRRRAQLAAVRPDLRFVELRGNIDTRLTKIPAGGAIVMALAALQILELTDCVDEILALERFVPAVGQGCVAVECRIDDGDTRAALAAVDHGRSRWSVELERAFLAELGSGCSLPVAGHVVDGVLHAFLADPERSTWVQEAAAIGGDVESGPPTPAQLSAARNVATSIQTRLG